MGRQDLVCGRENDVTDELIGHAHPEQMKLELCRYLMIPTSISPPAFIVRNTIDPPGAEGWLLIVVLRPFRVGRVGQGVFGEWLVVIVHFDPLSSKLLEFLGSRPEVQHNHPRPTWQPDLAEGHAGGVCSRTALRGQF